MHPKLRLLLAAAVGSAGMLAVSPPVADAQQCVPAGAMSAPVPWAQQMLAPERLLPMTSGAKQRVAVVSTGVSGNPLLAGRLVGNADFSPPTGFGRPTGKTDCLGTGTGVAGIIGGQQSSTIGFHGVAPNAQLLSAKVVGDDYPSGAEPRDSVPPDALAAAINWSVDQRATVITVASVAYQDSGALRQAVQRAQAADIVVVAAAGVAQRNDPPGVKPYPASYDGVVAVGMIGQDGQAAAETHAPRLDLVAPGSEVTVSYPDAGVGVASGTEFAAGYVAGTVALLRDYLPQLSNVEVVRRLAATATPAPEGAGSRNYGYGIVNPYQAVLANLADGHPVALPPADPNLPTAEEIAREEAWRQSRALALGLGGAGIALAAVLAAVAVFGPRGRRRRWRSGIAEVPADRPEDELPEPPAGLFDHPKPHEPAS